MNLLHGTRARIIDHRFLAMGTEISVKLVCQHRSQRPRALEAIGAVAELMHRFGREAWAWGDGALSQFNCALDAGETPAIPAELHDLFLRAWMIHRRSGGLFEPRIARLVRLWGFDDITRQRSAPPPAQDVEQLMNSLKSAPALNGAPVYGPAPGVAWDFGGIGKVIDDPRHAHRRGAGRERRGRFFCGAGAKGGKPCREGGRETEQRTAPIGPHLALAVFEPKIAVTWSPFISERHSLRSTLARRNSLSSLPSAAPFGKTLGSSESASVGSSMRT